MPPERKGTDRFEIKFLSELTSSGRHPGTVRLYERMIESLGCDLLQLKKETVIAYANRILEQKRLCPNGRIDWLWRLKIFLRWLYATKFTLSDLSTLVKVPKTKYKPYPLYLSQKEMASLLDGIHTATHEGLKARTMLELLYSTGLRNAEIRKLNQGDISFETGTVRVLSGKGHKDRVVPVGRTALYWLKKYLERRGRFNPNTSLFGVGSWFLRQTIPQCAKAAGIKKRVTAHTFRHSVAVHLLENGAGIRHIQAMLGHTHLYTTQRYTKVVPMQLKRVHGKTHPCERRSRILGDADPKRFYHIVL